MREGATVSEQHTYRVIVRGTWEGLTEEARTRLLAEAAEHGMASMRFCEEGSLTRSLRSSEHRQTFLESSPWFT